MSRLRRFLCGLLTNHSAATTIGDGKVVEYHCSRCGADWTVAL